MALIEPSVVQASWAPGNHGTISIIDDRGKETVLRGPAKRIICLYGAFNEILYSMGLEDRIVARTKADTFPPSIVQKPSIGTHLRPNVEMILGLEPDLVIQSGGRRKAMVIVNQLERHGIKVAVFQPATFRDLFSVIERIGILTGEEVRARDLVVSMKARLERIREMAGERKNRPTVFFEVRYPNLLAAGRASIVNDVIEHAGGVNCITVAKKLVRINMEEVISCDPDFYVVQQGPMNRHPSHPEERPNFQVLRSVRDGRVLFVDEQVFSRPGPRSVKAVEELARALFKESKTEEAKGI